MDNQPLRVGIIGANWGITHVEAWRRVPGVDVVAICTARRETAKANAVKYGIGKAYWVAEDMFADPKVDIIDLTLRPVIRTPLTQTALLSGKHVLQTLPFADTFAHARDLVETARNSGRIAMIENLHRYMPAFVYVREMINSGEVGEICTVHAQVRTDILVNPPPNYVYEWISREDNGASVLRNYGAHLLHYLNWVFGPVRTVTGRTKINLSAIMFSDGSEKRNETADSASLLLEFKSGVSASLDLCWCAPAGDGLLVDVVGTGGRIVLTADRLGPQNPIVMVASRLDQTLSPRAIPERFRVLRGTSIREGELTDGRTFPLSAMCHGMTRAIRQGRLDEDGPTFEEGLEIMRVIEATYQASERGVWVDVDTIS
jgi:predicted dehydrogenase